MKPAIFLSYASQDADSARRICDALRAAGLEVWFDQSELRGGDAWDASIRKQIKECALFVPIISPNTQSREEGYFRREWNFAVDRMLDMADHKTFLLPVMLDGVAQPDALVPDKFRERQWTRIDGDAAIAAFCARVAKLLAGRGSSAKNALEAAPVLEFGPVIERTTQADETPSIAVLAFANRSASAEDEYFSDGLADELLSVLAKIKGLRVIARTSSFVFKGKGDDVASIGQKLNVATLLEGSVRKSGNRVRISVQLVRCADSSHLWSETYDRTLDDIFAVQDDIAQRVVTELRTTLLGMPSAPNADIAREIAQATETRPENPEVQQKCQQARFLLEQRTRVSIETAIKRFREAIDIDPRCSSAFSGLAHALGLLSTHLVEQKQDLTQQSLSAAQTALRLDPRNASAHLALAAHALSQRRNYAEWIEAMDKAAELAPNNSQVLRLVAQRHWSLGELDDAQRCLDRAFAIDPLSATICLSRASLAMFKREFGLARSGIDDVIAMSPSWSMPYEELACLAQLSGDHALFVESRAKAFERAGQPNAAAFLRECYQQGGWNGLLDALVADRTRSGITRMEAAGYLLELGEVDKALLSINEAMEASTGEPTWNLTSDPRLLALHNHPRFLALAQRAGLRP